jgi:hypothetical protein
MENKSVHKSTSVVPSVNYANQVYSLPSYFFKPMLTVPSHPLYASKVGHFLQEIFFFSWRSSPYLTRGFSLSRLHDHTQTPQPVGLLWTSDQPDAETSIRQHKHSQETDIHAPGGIRTRNTSKRSAADRHLRPRGQWYRP